MQINAVCDTTSDPAGRSNLAASETPQSYSTETSASWILGLM